MMAYPKTMKYRVAWDWKKLGFTEYKIDITELMLAMQVSEWMSCMETFDKVISGFYTMTKDHVIFSEESDLNLIKLMYL